MTHVAQKLLKKTSCPLNIHLFKMLTFIHILPPLHLWLICLPYIYMPQSPLAQNQTHTRSIFILFSIHIFIHNHFWVWKQNWNNQNKNSCNCERMLLSFCFQKEPLIPVLIPLKKKKQTIFWSNLKTNCLDF
jgi:hypothetical protein